MQIFNRAFYFTALAGTSMLSASATAADCSSVITTLVSSCTLPSGSTSVETAGSVIGSNGSNGSNGTNGTTTPIVTAGGLGTAGSFGVSVSGSGVLFSASSDVSQAVSGGAGGSGGNGGSSSSSFGTAGAGGAGGAGGNGINNSGTLSAFNISSSVRGGAGGAGGRGGIATGSPGRGGNGGAGGQGGSGLYNTGTITTLTNTGSILGGSGGAGGSKGTSITTPGTNGVSGSVGYGIYNMTAITTLNNLQGASSTALSYRGNLPTNYNIIINSTSNFGKLAITAPSGSTTFGIHTTSTLSVATYSSVLTGVTRSSIVNYDSIFNVWNHFNTSYKWELVQGSNATTWDLVVASLSRNILPGSTNLISSLASGLNSVLEGGTLKADTTSTVVTPFTIKAAGGRIDANGLRSTFSGAFADDAGVSGKLTISNTGAVGQGAVVLDAANTHSGGTEVQAGANLSIASSAALGSGTLALVGSLTVPATLTTTATTTIANAITVSGDPVFNVAPGTTTTVSSPITDGASSGDVVVDGGGTLALTANNTYTGLTNITTGSTLVLSGDGAIATSSSVTNNGTFNITSKTSNVSVASYTQSSSGTLAMNVAPGPSSTQKLLVVGAASLAGGLSLTGSAGTYSAGKYALLTANGLTGTFGSLSSNLSSLTRLGYSLAYDANNVYLVFTPNTSDTQQSLVNTSQALQNSYALQNSVLTNSFSYDCSEFGANNICISAGGRNTAVSAANGLNNTSALLIAAYRPHPNFRFGAYADQNLSMSNSGSTVNLGNNTPLIGLFGAWNEHVDGTGAEVKVSAAYGQKNTTINRQVVGTSEAGSGSSQLNSQGAQVTAKYGFSIVENVIVAPYVGIRYTQNNMGGYTEGASSTVTAPLTYSALNINATTALAGLGVSFRVTPVVATFASAGVETDTNSANGTYSTTGIVGLTPINFNANPVKTRPTAILGASYDLAKHQRLGVTGIYRQEPYQGVSTTSVMATYMIGL